MGKFLESEKQEQAKFKSSSLYFSDAARRDGIYRGKAQSPVAIGGGARRGFRVWVAG